MIAASYVLCQQCCVDKNVASCPLKRLKKNSAAGQTGSQVLHKGEKRGERTDNRNVEICKPDLGKLWS